MEGDERGPAIGESGSVPGYGTVRIVAPHAMNTRMVQMVPRSWLPPDCPLCLEDGQCLGSTAHCLRLWRSGEVVSLAPKSTSGLVSPGQVLLQAAADGSHLRTVNLPVPVPVRD